MLWDLNDGKHLYTLDHADTINSLCFSPNRYWLCAATGASIKMWDLESKNMVEELRPEVPGNSGRADPPPGSIDGLVCRWPNPLCRLLRQPDSRLAGLHFVHTIIASRINTVVFPPKKNLYTIDDDHLSNKIGK